MACINFINLATARAGQRAREVALRKVLGASRRQLIVQFLGESLVVATLAMLIALAVVELTAPLLSDYPRCRFPPPLFRGRRHARCRRSAWSFWSARSAGSIRLSICRASSRPMVLKRQQVVGRAARLGPAAQRPRRRPVRRLDRPHHLHRGDLGRRPASSRPSIPAMSARASSSSRRVAVRRQLRCRPAPVRFGAGRHRDRSHQSRHCRRPTSRSSRSTPRAESRTSTSASTASMPISSRPWAWSGSPAGCSATASPTTSCPAIRTTVPSTPACRSAGSTSSSTAARPGCSASASRRRRSASRCAPASTAATWCLTHIVGVVEDTRIRTARDEIEPLVFMYDPARTRLMIVRYRSGRSARGDGGSEQCLAPLPPRRAVRSGLLRGSDRGALRARPRPRHDLRRFRHLRGDHLLPRPVRARLLHGRAADQGDRHPQGAGRARPRHRPAAGLAVHQAGA